VAVIGLGLTFAGAIVISLARDAAGPASTPVSTGSATEAA